MIDFVRRNKYWPNFKSPKTYNEKINYRKNNARHDLFSVCSDKIAAKDWVAEKIGKEYVIPNYFVGELIESETIKKIIAQEGGCLLKANHNSGPVKLLTEESSDAEIDAACNDVNQQLKHDFGERVNEPWYSKIRPRILVEKRLHPEKGESNIRDYKFHVFRKNDSDFEIFVAIDFDRGQNHSRSFFDSDFNYMNLSTYVPSVITKISKPKNYDLMLIWQRHSPSLFLRAGRFLQC